MAFNPQPQTALPLALDDSADTALRLAGAPAAAVRVRIILTQAARAHVLQSGLSNRLRLLIERADALYAVLLQGERIGLSESARHDLTVLHRRLVLEPAETVLEVILEVPGARS